MSKASVKKQVIKEERANNASEHMELVDVLLSSESPRTQEIIKKRYGLSQHKLHTLEKIGRDHNITRERVRQIIADSFKRISKKKIDERFVKFEDKISLVIKESDGIIREDMLMSAVGCADPFDKNAVAFLGKLSERIMIIDNKDGHISRSWATSKEIIEKVKNIRKVALEVLSGKKNGVNGVWQEDEIIAEIKSRVNADKVEVTHKEVLSHLNVLADVTKGKFGKWGMSHWNEINPKGTREKIYLILKENKSPLHFKDIAQLIDKYELSNKRAHPQTIHNELIKDKKFILIGRGIYALNEWGYKSGTIREVIEDVLKNSKNPLTKEEIFQEVLKLREVKKTTIMINLNNEDFFEKIGNTYTIKR